MVRATRVSRLVKRSLIAALIAEPWENVGGQSEIKKKKKKSLDQGPQRRTVMGPKEFTF
jgi:hypothetical protein